MPALMAQLEAIFFDIKITAADRQQCMLPKVWIYIRDPISVIHRQGAVSRKKHKYKMPWKWIMLCQFPPKKPTCHHIRAARTYTSKS